MKNTKVIVPIILVLVGLGVGFLSGYEYRNYRLQRQTGTSGTFQRFNGARTPGQNGMMGRGGVEGSILSVDATSMTVKLADGSTKIIIFSGSTTYSNTTVAAQSDLKTGSTVAVFGSTNSDGSVTATNVQINPINFRPQGTPGPTP